MEVNRFSNKNIKRKLSFGCRMMAFVKSGPSTVEDDIVRTDCLAYSPKSLKAQSMPGLHHRNGVSESYTREDFYKIYERKGNKDGWGIVGHVEGYKTPMIAKSPYAAGEDPSFITAAGYLNYYHPKITLAHVRLSTAGKTITDNCHPFVYKNWSFEHNGCLNSAKSKPVQEKVNGEYAKSLGTKPTGVTDSEAAFFYCLGRMKEQYGTNDTKQIGVENTAKSIASSLVELIDKDKNKLTKLDGSLLDLKGHLDLSPSCSVVMSDGDNLYALRKGHSLYYGRYINSLGERQYIITSEKMNTNRAGRPIEWAEIEEEHMIVIAKQSDGRYEPKSYALSELVPQYNTISEHIDKDKKPQAALKIIDLNTF